MTTRAAQHPPRSAGALARDRARDLARDLAGDLARELARDFARDFARDLARDLGRLVVPVDCAGCGRADVALCDDCRALLAGPAWRCEAAAPRLDRVGRAPLPVWAVASYTGPVRELVVAWKDRGRVDLSAPLRSALATAATDVAAVLAAAQVPSVLVVPVPSSPAARRRRGADLVGGLADAVAGGCAAGGLVAEPARVLGQRRGARDQVGLSARSRRANLEGRVRWRSRAGPPPPGHPVVLVDDVVTTGATLAACDDAVRAAGARVVAALTLAATPSPR